MTKMLLAGAAAISIAVVAFSGSANAACYWTGYNWDCATRQVYQQPYGYQYGYQSPHYGYTQHQSPYYGQYPQWYSTRYPGPRAGGGQGY